MKKLKIFLFISLAIAFFLITIYLFFYFLEMKVQGEYKKYDSGVTIEANNLSNKTLPDLKFLYTDSTEGYNLNKTHEPEYFYRLMDSINR